MPSCCASRCFFPPRLPLTAVHDGVLIIHSNQRPTPAAIIIEDTVRRTIDSGVMRPVDVFSEYLDVERFSAASYVTAVTEFLATKYGNRKVRVIVASAPQAVRFATKLRERIAPNLPIVHIALAKDVVARTPLPPGVIGATIDLDPLPTLQMAMRLQPDAHKLVIIVGADERDRVWEQRVRGAAGRLEGTIDVEYLSGLSTADLLRRVSMLPKDTIVFTPGYFVDGAGHVGSPRQSLELIAPASAAPVYGPIDTFLGTGIVGGYMAPYEDQSKRAGSIVVSVLNGVATSAVHPSSVPNVPIVDARQIRRWGMDERLLPPGTVVKFRELSAWDRYRGRDLRRRRHPAHAGGIDRPAPRRAQIAPTHRQRIAREPGAGQPRGTRRAAVALDLGRHARPAVGERAQPPAHRGRCGAGDRLQRCAGDDTSRRS